MEPLYSTEESYRALRSLYPHKDSVAEHLGDVREVLGEEGDEEGRASCYRLWEAYSQGIASRVDVTDGA